MSTIFDLLNEIKDRPSLSEAELAKRVQEFSRSRSALIEWQLILPSGDGLSLTPSGKEVAWAADQERRDLILRNIALRYPPYEIILNGHRKQSSDTLATEDVQRTWASKLDVAISRENLSAAAATLFQVLEEAGLGNYIVGRGGKPTRIEFNGEARSRIEKGMNAFSATPLGGQPVTAQASPISAAPPQANEPQVPRFDSRPGPTKDAWDILATSQFELKIQRNPQAWALLKALVPVYEQSVFSASEAKDSTKTTKDSGELA